MTRFLTRSSLAAAAVLACAVSALAQPSFRPPVSYEDADKRAARRSSPR